jgi:glucokinase
MENDARAALVGEWRHGAGKGYRNLLMVTIGTGVGSAVLLDGHLLKGSRYLAGNLGGHQVVRFDGQPCNCGNTGCLESEASSWSLPGLVRRTEGYAESPFANGVPANFEQLFRLAEQGDVFALSVQRHCLRAWAAGISNFVYAFDPEIVVLGGGVMNSADVILPFLRRHIDQLAWLPGNSVRVAAASQPDWAGVLGMAYLAGDR